jgi:hypothetical protein
MRAIHHLTLKTKKLAQSRDLSQAEERKNHAHDNNEPDQINNVIHYPSSSVAMI